MLIPTNQYHVRLDTDTGQYVACTGSVTGDYTVIGPLLKGAVLQGGHGNQANVSDGGSLAVHLHSDGMPQIFYDAAANADDTYYDLGTVLRECTSMSVACATKDAIVSLNGGVTDHLYVRNTGGADAPLILTGLHIPAGAVISAKNEAANNDYASLYISVW